MKRRLLIIMSLGIFGFFTLSFLLSPSIFGEPYCTDGRFNTDCKSWNNWEWIYYNLSGYRDYPPPLNLSEINLQRVLESERKILECYGIFNCNVSSQYFESCIGAKKNGVTIEQLCLDSDITIDNGCATIVFPDGVKTISCHYEIRK